MSNINVSVQGVRTPYMESNYTEKELDFIEKRNFENMVNYFSDILIQIKNTGSSKGLSPRQRINLVKSGIIARSTGRSRYRILPKAQKLILKMDEEENQT